jgi:hypothetical protein
LEGKATLALTPDHKLDWAFLRPQEPVKFTEGTGKVMSTIPPNDFSYFEMINDLVQKEPAGALDPEIMGSLAAVGIVKDRPFTPDANSASAVLQTERTCFVNPPRTGRGVNANFHCVGA